MLYFTNKTKLSKNVENISSYRFNVEKSHVLEKNHSDFETQQ